MGNVKNQREEQRLRYRWYLKYANDANESNLTGQMFDISSRGMAFLCHWDENCPNPGELITTRFAVPCFDSGDSFDLIFFNRLGQVCRVDDLGSRVRRVAIQFAKPLFFKPGEQNISASEAQQRLNTQNRARTETEKAKKAEAEEKTGVYIKTIKRLEHKLEAERAARLKAEGQAQANRDVIIEAQEDLAAYARARGQAEKTAETESEARVQAQQHLKSEIEARIEAEERLKIAIEKHSEMKAQAAEEIAAVKSKMSEAIHAAVSEAQKETESAASLKAEEQVQANKVLAAKAQEELAAYARARDEAQKTAETESEARVQAQQHLKSEIEARIEAEERLKIAIKKHSKMGAQAAEEIAYLKSGMIEAIRAAKSEAQKKTELHVEMISRLKDDPGDERAARLKAQAAKEASVAKSEMSEAIRAATSEA
ncbi:MAG: PilZ domain-containing protein, partial [Planctomycetes bacterium]|nr:PilZ domain-containing protein [Planctomycetota bacterium]